MLGISRMFDDGQLSKKTAPRVLYSINPLPGRFYPNRHPTYEELKHIDIKEYTRKGERVFQLTGELKFFIYLIGGLSQ